MYVFACLYAQLVEKLLPFIILFFWVIHSSLFITSKKISVFSFNTHSRRWYNALQFLTSGNSLKKSSFAFHIICYFFLIEIAMLGLICNAMRNQWLQHDMISINCTHEFTFLISFLSFFFSFFFEADILVLGDVYLGHFFFVNFYIIHSEMLYGTKVPTFYSSSSFPS